MDDAGLVRNVALPVVNCVQHGIRPDHLLRDRTRDELRALVTILARAVDPAAVWRAVSTVGSGPAAHEALLRKAHTEAQGYRTTRRKVPAHLAALEREYWRWRKQEQRKARAA